MADGRTTRVAGPEDRDGVVDLVVDAFREDPAFCYFFADGHDSLAPPAVAQWFDRRVGGRTVWVTTEGGALAGVSMWEVLDGDHAEPPATPGAGADGRMARYHAVLDPHLPAGRHWYLGILAVAAPFRGTGVARAVVAPGLERAAAEAVPTALETTNPDNVARYRHWGWEVTAELADAEVPTIWVLRRDP